MIKMKIYNGENMLLGRLGSLVAKDALLGEEVRVVNCDKIMVSGKKFNVYANVKERRLRKGYPLKSAKLSRLPERYVRRSIRGMLPWKHTRGKEAFKRIMCYSGTPEELADQKYVEMKGISVKKLPTMNFVTVKEICKYTGWESKQ
jgi:large subunit ribosomal protein L13